MKRSLLLLACASSLAAAQNTVAVRGLAFDSLHGKPLSGAFIGIAGMNVSATSDSVGQFILQGVPQGTHRIVMQHDVLDAIGISAAGTRAVVTDGKATVVVAVPSFETLWRAACGTTPPGGDTAFVFGTVQRARQPVPNAVVAATWIDLFQDSPTAVRQRQRTLEVDADSTGNYAACGVPTSTGLSLRANMSNEFGAWLDVPPLNRERVARRDLVITTAAEIKEGVAKGATFVGRIKADSTSAGIRDVEVSLPELGLKATTNERGEFRIADVIQGTHIVQGRKLGYAALDTRVDFQSGEIVDRTFAMQRITTLDSVSVLGKAPRDEAMRLFDEHRKIGLGKFFTREDLEKARDRKMIDILGQLPGVKPQVNGSLGYLLSNRGTTRLQPTCEVEKQDYPGTGRKGGAMCLNQCFPHVFLDGVDVSPSEVPNINRFSPSEIEAIEYYAGAAQVPPEYNRLNRASCGVIVIHSRRAGRP